MSTTYGPVFCGDLVLAQGCISTAAKMQVDAPHFRNRNQRRVAPSKGNGQRPCISER